MRAPLWWLAVAALLAGAQLERLPLDAGIGEERAVLAGWGVTPEAWAGLNGSEDGTTRGPRPRRDCWAGPATGDDGGPPAREGPHLNRSTR